MRCATSSKCSSRVARRSAWRSAKRGHHLGQRGGRLVVIELEHAVDDRSGPGLAVDEPFLTWDEQLGQHSLEGRAAADGGCVERRSARSPSRRARARGRAAAWPPWPTSIRRPGSRCDRPRGDRRSRRRWSARRATSRRRCRRGTSRSPGRRRRAQRVSPVSRKARAHASARAATSIGCWSKAGRGSPSDQPPTGVTERWSSLVSMSRSQPSRCRPSSSARASPRCSPAAMRASGSAALAYWRRASGHGHVALPVGRPITRTAAASSARAAGSSGCDGEDLRRAERGEGHRPAVSAAPSGAASEAVGGALANGNVGERGPSRFRGPTAPVPSSPRLRARPSTGDRVRGGCGSARRAPGRRVTKSR